MHKRYLPITIATTLLFLVALGGYLVPAAPEEMPVRVLLDNKGGKVILAHASHAEILDRECGACHHTTGNAPNPPACSDCHAAKFDAAFRAEHKSTLKKNLCDSCHHRAATASRFIHDDHAADYTDGDCQTCHHDESIEPEPQSCSNCHMDDSGLPRLRDAVHNRCADCHADMYDDGIKGCSNCHERDETREAKQIACSSCHETPVDQLLPTSMNAFHGQCMSCHQKMEAGPVDDDACYQCHMK